MQHSATLDQLLSQHGITRRPGEFACKVYAFLLTVPAGKVVSYRDIGRALGTRAYRAIGQVLKRNPLPVVVPCHRVVRSDGTIGGYMGATSGPKLDKKRTLLAKEGVRFDQNDRVIVP